MNIIILSQERSLNKSEGLLNALRMHNVYLVVEDKIGGNREYTQYANVIISRGFNIIDIVNQIPNCDQVWCVSENLLPIQSQLESFYGIDNLSPFAAEVLSNKQMFDNFCRQIGLEDFVPNSITPTFYNQLNRFGNAEIFTKPDIGTGSNVFFPGADQNTPNIEYRRWNNKHHFLKHLKDKISHNDFFELNKNGIHSNRFNNKTCKIMVQEYFWSQEPCLIPIGIVKNGKVDILCYLKTTKVKYGDILDSNKSPIELHSNSRKSDIAKDLAVWSVSIDEVDPTRHSKMLNFLQTLIANLKVKTLFFAGPDFHIHNEKLIAIDFNPRPGQFMNILDRVNNYTVVSGLLEGKTVELSRNLLWGCAMLQPGLVQKVNHLDIVSKYFNKQNTEITEGVVIPEFQNLQNKNFNVNLDIIGKNEQELFTNYKQVNQLLQNCISY